jgi:hypothetical protein
MACLGLVYLQLSPVSCLFGCRSGSSCTCFLFFYVTGVFWYTIEYFILITLLIR